MNQAMVVRYAAIRAIGTGVCVVLGVWWFPSHETWVALTFVLVLRPPQGHAIVAGVSRTLGTVAGVLVGIALARLAGASDLSLIVAFAICAFGMVSTSKVNYAVFTTFLTALLLIAQRIIEGDVFSTGLERLGATAIGVVAAFLAIAVVRRTITPQGDM